MFLLQDKQNHNSSRDIILSLSLSLSVCLPFCLSLSLSLVFSFFLSLHCKHFRTKKLFQWLFCYLYVSCYVIVIISYWYFEQFEVHTGVCIQIFQRILHTFHIIKDLCTVDDKIKLTTGYFGIAILSSEMNLHSLLLSWITLINSGINKQTKEASQTCWSSMIRLFSLISLDCHFKLPLCNVEYMHTN